MASITIRNLDESTKQALRERAAQNGRSMEEEARLLLAALEQGSPGLTAGIVEHKSTDYPAIPVAAAGS